MTEDTFTKMMSMVGEFPDLLTNYSMNQDTQDSCNQLRKENPNGIIFLGMGGSAIAGLYTQALFRDSSRLPILVNRDDSLPAHIDSGWIVLAISYSGNTEETIITYDEAVKRNCKVFAITSGGELLSKENGLRKIRIAQGYQPRAAFPIIFSVVLNLVECLMGLEPTELSHIASSLSRKAKQWEDSSLAPKLFARDLTDHIPVFIGSKHLVPVAYRAKCQMNENAKTMAFFSEIPEANHNEIESFVAENDFKILPIFLRSAYEDKKSKKRMDITTTIYEDEGYSPIRLSIESSNKLEEMLALTFYLDLVSVQLAQIRGVDPTSVERISRLKRELE